MIVIVIVKVGTSTIADGQVDSPWVLFWLHTEAAVAVIVLSMTAFRVLFVQSENARSWKQLNQNGACQKGMTRTSPSSSAKDGRTRKDNSLGSVKMDFPVAQSDIMVTHELSTRNVRE
ncbi:hypothetical protein EPUS_03609 [Endocarpon pusillum Z07020]|uniref:Uncharacterized protein n=1 Tax=Endocarpon pusillum (strain Z07020 / HMAS-L-300199) TaxID=1263415 RepID=U1FXL6_ENDPU|nr:uncharacterized protein EPUS_03609 [Endocarpon pusillum Z07020]ERF69617.1 hypothetical protein EPUS_03609 [Endocarpon pusillum Z07020]